MSCPNSELSEVLPPTPMSFRRLEEALEERERALVEVDRARRISAADQAKISEQVHNGHPFNWSP